MLIVWQKNRLCPGGQNHTLFALPDEQHRVVPVSSSSCDEYSLVAQVVEHVRLRDAGSTLAVALVPQSRGDSKPPPCRQRS